jgi:phosphoribosylformylglycinamidine synthase
VLVNEELGAVVQVAEHRIGELRRELTKAGFPAKFIHDIGRVNTAGNQSIIIQHAGTTLLASTRAELESAWAETSYRMQALRDNPACAKQEFEAIKDDTYF